MPSSENELQSQLECLRLASDLTQLASDTLSAELREHCLRMAKVWTDRVEERPNDDSGYFYLDC